MINNKTIKNICIFVASLASLTLGGLAHAFVGSLAVGLGEMDQEIGRIQVSFAADAKIETEEMKATAHINYKPGKVRDTIDTGGQEMVMIRRMDINKFWMIMGQGMYMDIDPDKGNDQAPQYKLISREVIGPETVNGIPTTKFKSIYESSDGKFGGFTWFTDDNIAVKAFLISETKGEKQRLKFEFTSLNRGKQADSLFEIPPGYKPFSMGGMMNMEQMGQMGQMQQGSGAAGNKAAPANQSGDNNGKSDGDTGFAGEVAEEAQKTAEDTAKQETKTTVNSSIKKGIGKLFGR